LPLIVNGDVTDEISAREALAQSGADAIMIGRASYGRPWIARSIDRALRTGDRLHEPNLMQRLEIALDHLADSLRFYGDALGLKIFRKHLGWYIEHASWPVSREARRAARAQLCRLESAAAVEAALTALWGNEEAIAA
jgi:tRNA-dihydrouridine synthase